MAGMAVSASTGVMNSLLSKLSTLLSDQYKQLKGVGKDIEFLRRELIDMNAVLEKLADMDNLDCQTKAWRDKVREMAYDIEDCIDKFMLDLGQGHDKDGLFHKTARKIRKLRARHQIANKIQEIKARVMEQSESRDRYKVTVHAATSRVPPVDPRVQAMFEDPNRLVGIDGPSKHITKWLMEEGDSDFEQLKVVSVVGFGGLGKTTLANQVYSEIKNEFECTAFVSVSRRPHMSKILKEILSGVGYGSMNMVDDEDKIIMALREQLAKKRYLIIIDDIWSITSWNIIRCAFVRNNKKSRVITTTRIQEVAKACCSECQGYVYEIQPLNNHDSRMLFFKRLFDTKEGCPKEYREVSEDILRKCRGVPLAITSIANLLATQGMHVEKWEKVFDSMGSELETSPSMEWMRHVLSLSYNDLPHDLKTCFLYIGAYPEDYVIRKDDLVRQWIAEGFVPEKRGLDLEDVAEDYFNELINRSMIQAVTSGRGDKCWCRVHDLMLDLILLKCTEENFIITNDSLYNVKGASQVRRISHQFHDENMAVAVERMSLSQVRSYMFYPAGKCVLVLSKFELLRVLHLDLANMDLLHIFGGRNSECLNISSISHLSLLRYLKVTGFRLKLQEKIWKFQHLITLDMEWNRLLDSSNRSLDVTSLSSLRHLTLPHLRTSKIKLRNGVSKLRNLQTLCGFDISMNSVETIRDLSELANLKHLTLTGKEGDSDTMTQKYDTLATSLRKLGNGNLRHLNVCFSVPEQFWSFCFTRPHHLQLLVGSGRKKIKTPQVPKWMMQADRLAYLDRLEVQQLLSNDVQILAQMPCLVHLNLSTQTFPEKCIVFHSKAFPVLKEFEFTSYELPCLRIEQGAMPRLKELHIEFGSYTMEHEISPVDGIQHLESLEKVYMMVHAIQGDGSKLETLCRDSIQRHQRYESIITNLNYYNCEG